ncbi:hypothetical protein [Nocardioides pacificus]
MKPLQSLGMGLLVILVVARLGGYDLLYDPAGWLLVLLGVRDLPARAERRRTLLGVAALAGAVAAVVWFPTVQDAVSNAHASLNWALNLPQLAFLFLLCRELGHLAGDEDPSARTWAGLIAGAQLVLAALPVLVDATGSEDLEAAAYAGGGLVLLTLVILLLVWAGRPWAASPRLSVSQPPD